MTYEANLSDLEPCLQALAGESPQDFCERLALIATHSRRQIIGLFAPGVMPTCVVRAHPGAAPADLLAELRVQIARFREALARPC